MSDDPYADDVVVLLPFDGEEGSAELTDYAPVPGSAQCFGAAQLTLVDSRDGRAALVTGRAATSYVQHTLASSVGLGSADFTIECWLRPDVGGSNSRSVIDCRAARTQFAPWVQLNLEGAYPLIELRDVWNNARRLVAVIELGQWQHLAISRSSGLTRMFLDGEEVDSTYTPLSYSAFGTVLLGKNTHVSTPLFAGLLQDFRITIGVARYVGNFSPPDRLLDSLDVASPPAWAELPSPLAFKSAFGRSAWATVAGAAPWIDTEVINPAIK